MANASPNARGPNATHISLARVGVALGPQGILGTNMLVSATQKSCVGGIALNTNPQFE